MMEPRTEQRELEFSDRFSGGEETARDSEEARAFESYRCIREQLTDYPLPEIDRARLMQRMAAEMKRTPRRTSRFAIIDWLSRPAFAAVVFVGALLCVGGSFTVLRGPEIMPVERIHFSQLSGANEASLPSWLWRHRLQQGKRVTVPPGVSAELLLAEGSVIDCSPETSLAVRIADERRIRLDAGHISVNAASIPDQTMTVETPLMDIQVLGTVFHVTIRP